MKSLRPFIMEAAVRVTLSAFGTTASATSNECTAGKKRFVAKKLAALLSPAPRPPMFEARIVSPRGSLYFAAEATPYDLEAARQHLRAFMPKAADVQLEVRVDEADAIVPALLVWLRQLADAGVQVTRSPARVPPSRDEGAPDQVDDAGGQVGEIADGLAICAVAAAQGVSRVDAALV